MASKESRRVRPGAVGAGAGQVGCRTAGEQGDTD